MMSTSGGASIEWPAAASELRLIGVYTLVSRMTPLPGRRRPLGWLLAGATKCNQRARRSVRVYAGNLGKAAAMAGMRRSVLAGTCALGVAVAVTAAAWAASQARVAAQGRKATGAGGWQVTAMIGPAGNSRVFMSGVSAPAADDVWAVGGTMTSSDQSFPVLEHWNGQRWKSVMMPRRFAGVPFEPYQVAASSAANVWVFTSAGKVPSHTAGQWGHWNGRSWSTGTVPAMRVAGDPSPVVTITAAAPPGGDEVWVGGTVADGQSKFGLPAAAFLACYDGHAWRTYRFPQTMPDITGISALSRTDVWADVSGGQGTSGVGATVTDRNMLLHWDGRSLRQIPAPKALSAEAVTGESAHAAWVTGQVTAGKSYEPGAAYWNGKRWTIVLDPALATTQWRPADSSETLTSAVPDGNGGLWAVAEPYPPLLGSLPGQASVWHYTNGRWTGVHLNRLGYLNLLQLARAPGSTSIWAAGTTVTTAAPGYPQDGAIPRYQN